MDSVQEIPQAHSVMVDDQMLSRAYLEADDLCNTSSSIYRLLSGIWAYIPPTQAPEMTGIELAAGHHFWLPDGSLAAEWVRFFKISPDRFLEMAPLEVKTAFAKQVGIISSFATSFGDIMEQQNGKNSPPSEFEDMALLLDLVMVQESSEVREEYIPVSLPSTCKTSPKKRSYDVFAESSSSALPVAKRSQPENRITTTIHRAATGAPSSVVQNLSLPIVRGTNIPQVALVTNPALPNVQATLAVQSVQSLTQAPIVNPAPAVFPLLSCPTGAVAFIENPAGPQQFLRQHGFVPVMALPGSLLPSVMQYKAWHAQRIRAWVEIEGKQLSKLPGPALSSFGNEMSNLRTPESVDPRLCPFPTSIEENFTYFPNTCTLNREMCIRARQSWSPINITRYINYAHDVTTFRVISRSRITYQFREASRFAILNPHIFPTASLGTISTESGIVGENRILHDYFLYHMGDGVRHPPTGRQAQMLTRVIEHVRNVTQDRNVRLSEASQYAQRHGISVPVTERIDFANLPVEDAPSRALLDTIREDYVRKFGCHPD
ncbi:hypothetical protein GMOD_00000026 [Pyrenophora seminiperda CCB06]|uniref:Uncharacterized protein n=1 Tax=Pyrenophora seminiperda CCB06 TaxID=1302712 RepID=A0A3M7M6B7_9PLEO|nr:hypothetical protein GMOD_00000026 [Pyrenophora seminiperda CCB06]